MSTDLGPTALRPLRETDAPAVLEAFLADAEGMSRQGGIADPKGARGYVAHMSSSPHRAIVDGQDRVIGLVAITVDEEHRAGWFFYWLHPRHRGEGLMAHAAREVADLALRPEEEGGWGLERLELGHRRNNPASGAVARAAGFVQEGVERGKFLVDGVRIDVLTYGRLRSDPVPPAGVASEPAPQPRAGQAALAAPEPEAAPAVPAAQAIPAVQGPPATPEPGDDPRAGGKNR